DKTGTLTKGEPELTDMLPTSAARELGLSEETLALLVATVEARSEHPVASALTAPYRAAASTDGAAGYGAAGGSGGVELTSLSDFEAVPGHGVSGTVLLDVQAPHERPIWRVHVGSPRFMRRLGAALGDEALVAGERLAAEGKTVVYVAVE